MDDRRFDVLTKFFSTGHTRRGLTRLLGGVSLGGVLSALGRDEASAALLNGGAACTKGSQCNTGKCLANGTCSCSHAFPTCKRPRNPCKQATCDFATKRCVTSNKPRGTACPDDGNPCTRDICDGSGACIHPNRANWLTCPDGMCQDGSCQPEWGSCPIGADICTDVCPGEDCSCSGGNCLCYTTRSGATRCGFGQGCGNCTRDDTCVTRHGAGAFCVDFAAPQCTQESVACPTTDTGFCAKPCTG